jgi:sortase (surface protein transpeptidase)
MNISLTDRLLERKYPFLVTFFLVFFFSYLLLVAIDFVPEVPAIEVEETSFERAEEVSDTVLPAEGVREVLVRTSATNPDVNLPTTISIKKLDRVITVLNPTSRTIANLDAALLEGVVRHPDSANLLQDGNVFILGHSSYLPTVRNRNFQAFNGIEDLAWGDEIEVSSGSHVYVYEVEKVYKANAQELTVPIAGDTPRLVLATCNSFGSVDDRFIVEARQVSIRPL